MQKKNLKVKELEKILYKPKETWCIFTNLTLNRLQRLSGLKRIISLRYVSKQVKQNLLEPRGKIQKFSLLVEFISTFPL